MKRAYFVPARYRPEIEAVLASAVRHIELSMKNRELGGTSDFVDVDDSLTGELVILIGDTRSKPELVTTIEESAA